MGEINEELLRRVWAAILESPERWDQQDFGPSTLLAAQEDCKTTMCLAGWTNYLREETPGWSRSWWAVGEVPPADRAQEHLGLDGEQAFALFCWFPSECVNSGIDCAWDMDLNGVPCQCPEGERLLTERVPHEVYLDRMARRIFKVTGVRVGAA